MQELNLIEQEKSSIPFSKKFFSDGQPHIKIDVENFSLLNNECCIITRMSNPTDFILALFAQDALKSVGFQKIHLIVSYLTTSRTDRRMSVGEPLSLEVTARILNGSEFSSIKIFNPHSNDTLKFINKSIPINDHQFVKDVFAELDEKNNWNLIAVDAGALVKIKPIAEMLGDLPIIHCTKKRDLETGKIIHFEVEDEVPKNAHCLIIDDILDKGDTIINVANALKEKGAARIVAIVSHGVFSKGFDIPFVDEIFTTDSFQHFQQTPVHIKVKSILPYLKNQ